MVLDDGAHETVEGVICHQQILELVQAYHGQPAVRLVESKRHIEQLEQRGAGFVGRRACRSGGERHVYARNPCRHAEASGPSADYATRIGWQLLVSLGHPCRDVCNGCDLGEVDPNGSVANGAHCMDVRVDEARLSKAAGCGEADRNPVGRGTLESVELIAAVDQASWGDRP